MDCAVISTPYNHVSFKRRKNTWYTIADGNWSDRNIWMSNSFRKYNYPQAGDDVYVNHNIIANVSTTVNNLRVAGYLTFANSVRIDVIKDIQVTGTIDINATNCTLYLYGDNNFIKNINYNINGGTIYFAKIGNQPVLWNTTLPNISFTNSGTKYLTSPFSTNIVVDGNMLFNQFDSSNILDVTGYDLTVIGIYHEGAIIKNDFGHIIFAGEFQIWSSSRTNLPGNATIECRGGIRIQGVNQNITSSAWGNGALKFTTNNQQFYIFAAGSGFTIPNPVTIDNVTLESGQNTSGLFSSFYYKNTINGTTPTSKFVNRGDAYYRANQQPMLTGLLDCTSYSNSFIYDLSGDQQVAGTTYANLTFGASGVKKLMGNVVVTGTYSVTGTATVDLNGFTLTHP